MFKFTIERTLLYAFLPLVVSATAFANDCIIYVSETCAANPAVSVNQWFVETSGVASSYQLQCMQRAADYQSYCGTPFAYSAFISNGNLVAYEKIVNGKPEQFALTPGTAIPMDNFYSNPSSHLDMQTDGNLVVYSNGAPLWATSAMVNNSIPQGAFPAQACSSNCLAVMQSDGNLVLYNSGGSAYWASNTFGHVGARLVLNPTPPVAEIVDAAWGWSVPWSSMTGVFPPVDSLNALIRANPGYVDFLVQDVCVDQFDHATAGDPAYCVYHRNIRIGEKVPYILTDMDMGNNYARYQGNFSYPVMGTDGNLKVMVSKSMHGGLDPSFDFQFSHINDGFDLIDTNGDHTSGIRTSDGGCFDQVMAQQPGRREDGWIFFGKDMGAGWLNHDIMISRISPDRRPGCDSGQDTSGGTQDIWNPPTAVGFESGKVLNSIVTYHFANENWAQTNNAMERYFFTREYGFTRWEGWQPLARCIAERGDGADCHPERGNKLAGRCDSASSVANWGGQNWVRLDCRDTTFFVPLNTPLVPVNGEMAQNNGLQDIVSNVLFYLW